MKKNILLIMTFIFTLLLVACNGGGNKNKNKISLSYADWNADIDTTREMIEEFEKEYPHITVELRTDIAGHGETFTNNLVDAAGAGILPDVFATDNVPVIAEKGLTLDVAKYWDNDDDAKLVYEFMQNTAIYGQRRYAIPSFQFLKGIMINLDIFENSGLKTNDKYRIDSSTGYPVKDWTFSEFIEIAKAIKNFPGNDENTVIGLDTWYGAPDFNQVWPMMTNPDFMYDTWDGEKFNYTHKSWIDATKMKMELHKLTDGTTNRYEEGILEEFPFLDAYIIETGYGAMDIEGSWQFNIIQTAKERDINIGFWPYPRPAEGQGTFFPPVILDYLAISSATEHPEEAYLLGKWMSYGRKGWEARIEIFENKRAEEFEEGKPMSLLDRYPVANYPEIWDKIDPLVEGIEGIQETFLHIHNGKPDIDKWMPGYRDFIRWMQDPDNPNNFDLMTEQGPQTAELIAPIYNKKINELFKESLDKLIK
ncbi:ABC transporter substrate-binding protein [Haploplasma modicum]|uniref:ABC transporter substrate-binding protein n=1 Tax=Haploplasma modicum TaxID=2150 RepID=UPI00214B463B|nr:ABC transporter substrate-binding protein [Haploplasma modicum]MCR1808789.1 ABC transporter substrate-binding protein [Haploplasma modicum]